MDDWIGTVAQEMTAESATAMLKEWLALTRHMAHSRRNLQEYAGIGLTKLASTWGLESPTPAEFTEFCVATGYPVPERVLQAAEFLHLLAADKVDPAASASECEINSRRALKAWLKAARVNGGKGRLTQGQLGARIGKSQISVAAWENPNVDRIPKWKDIKAIAEACGTPEPTITFDMRSSTADSSNQELEREAVVTLSDEILQTGRFLSRRAHASTHVDRNAQVFRMRYGGSGNEESTLQSIGDVYRVTRERIRQIVDKQLSFVPLVSIRTDCFDALAKACLELEPVTVSVAEERLRHLLGGNLSLQGASAYGREVLGRPLPVQIVQIRHGDTIVISGDLPPWFQVAITQSKAIIRHCGAAQFNLAWALTMRQHQDWISPDQFRQVISHAPGFDWIDDDETWFWLGPEGSANRLVKRTTEILAFAKRPLDVEIIYGGLTRYARTRDSGVSEDAGVWPPMEIVQKVLAKSPALVCQQGDDFRLAAEGGQLDAKQGVAETILAELRVRGGIASRSELHQALVVDSGMSPISFSVALARSPLLRQVDRGVFAIRGWPISAMRLTEAQQRVGNVSGPLVNFKEVDVTRSGDVSWVNTLSKSSMSNMYAGVPSKALLHLPEGDYSADGAVLSITEHRMVGLVRLVMSNGGVAGTLYRTTANARMRTVKVEIVGQEDQDDEDQE